MPTKFRDGFRPFVDYAYHLSELGVQQALHRAGLVMNLHRIYSTQHAVFMAKQLYS